MNRSKTDSNHREKNLANRIPLTIKMVSITIAVGLVILMLSDSVLTNVLNQSLLQHFDHMLAQQAKENRMFFSSYLKSFKGAAKTITITARFRDYLNTVSSTDWRTSKDIKIKYYRDVPPWLPKPSVLRSFVYLDYVMLLDDRHHVREVYLGHEEELPGELLDPPRRLLRLSQGQSLLTTFGGKPFMIRSEPVNDEGEVPGAFLVLASPIDTDFLIASQGGVNPDNMLALVEGGDAHIVTSTHPHLFPEGNSLSSFEDAYLIDKTGKIFFDLGASELEMQIASFVNKSELIDIARTITMKERKLRFAGTAILITAFVFLMIWVTGNIRRLTRRVIDFTQNKLGVASRKELAGDELFILDTRFHKLTEEVELSRKAMQQYSESLRNERDKAQNYLDIAGAIIVALNTRGEVALINKKGCAVLGYCEDEILGKNWFNHFLPERARDSVQREFHMLIDNPPRGTASFESPVLNSRHEERFISWNNTIIRDEHHRITGILSSGEDISERKKLEKALLEIEDRERQSIGYELHDSLGQLLTGISFKCKCLQNELRNRSAPEAEEIAEIGSLINEAKVQTKMLARGLSPIGTEGGGLMSGLESLALNTRRLFNIRCSFICRKPVQLINEKAILQLYRIAQEAVTNAVRHSQCKTVEIELEKQEDRVAITIRDDGIGINGHPEVSGGMGLKIMRYRAGMISAHFDVQGSNGGTIVRCVFPDRVPEMTDTPDQ